MSNQNKIRFANTVRFLFNGDKAIILNRLNGTWLKIPRQCYDIIRLCEEDELSIAELSAKLADDDDRAYMTELIGLLDSMGCLYYDSQQSVDNVSFSVTHRCNLNCIHCMVEAECNGKEQDYFNTATICDCLDKIVAVKPRSIILTGGEPLLRLDFFEILQYLRSKFTGSISLMTNATLISSGNVKLIVDLVDSIDISLDGADESSCSIIRGKGVFQKVIESIKLLQSQDFRKINLSMVLSQNNCQYVERFMELNEKLSTSPMLRALSYEGRAAKNRSILDEDTTNIQVDMEQSHREQECRGCTCTAGYDQLTVEANGDVFPCNLFVLPEFKLGNIRECGSLGSLLQTENDHFISQCIHQFEPNEFSSCKECNINYFCWSCLYPMHKISKEEFQERCAFKKSALAHVWE